MILHSPIIKKHDDQVTISSRFEIRSALPNIPQDLYYRFPERYEPFLALSADGFAATALLVAMYTGEDLTIRAPISPKLAYGLIEYRNIFHTWLPKLFRMIDIKYENVEKSPQTFREGFVASAFSGGVDSFFTLWSHLPENQAIPDARITHGLFIHGYDLRLDEEDVYQAIAQKYSTLFQNLGLNLILASTNAYHFSQFRIDWSLFHGAPLIGAAQLLSPFLGRFYVPSFLTYNKLAPQGSSVLVDHLLSTEGLDIIHHGASTSRFEKLTLLTKWPATYDHLRVCANKQQSSKLQNCSRCHKCYRTMTALAVLNTLSRYSTFSSKLYLRDYFRWGIQTHMNLDIASDISQRAWKSGKVGLALGTWLSISINSMVKIALKFLKLLVPQKILYQIKSKLLKPEFGEERQI
jgi:hypothetical protein